MGQACQCDCDDGQHEMYQEMVMSAKQGQKPHNGHGDPQIVDVDDPDMYNQGTLKPLKRNKIKRENSEGDLAQPGYGQDGAHD